MTRRPGDSIVIAIPAMNEADRLGACLSALAAQRDAPPRHAVVLLNNCSDDSEGVVCAFPTSRRLKVSAVVRQLEGEMASAGVARSLAMEIGAGLLCPNGVLMTTDADSRVSPNWVAANLAALRRADAVAGRAVIDPVEALAIPTQLHEDDARECAYAALLDEIAALIDPDPCDPWPRHDEHSGASIAVHAAVYRRAGGVPALALGEDRAFFTALRRIDARVRHAPDVWVTVSGRIVGRAKGGMADTMRRRMQAPDPTLDDRLETVDRAVLRARLRRMARNVYVGAYSPWSLARAMLQPVDLVHGTLRANCTFGAGWERLESACAMLSRQAVPVSALAAQTRRATAVRNALKQHVISGESVDPGDTVHAAAPNQASKRKPTPA